MNISTKNKRANNIYIYISHFKFIKTKMCRNTYVVIHVWTYKWINNKTKQINSAKLYTEISVLKKY